MMQTLLFAFPEVGVSAPSLGAIVAFVLAAVLLLCSAYASGSEIAFFSITREDLDTLTESKSCLCISIEVASEL